MACGRTDDEPGFTGHSVLHMCCGTVPNLAPLACLSLLLVSACVGLCPWASRALPPLGHHQEGNLALLGHFVLAQVRRWPMGGAGAM